MSKRAPQTPAVQYTVGLGRLHAHLYTVTMVVATPQKDQMLRLPVWIPGSYLVREFSKHLQELTARQNGRSVAVTQLEKAVWQLKCNADQPVEISYSVYALDNSVRTAWLDGQRGFFNGTSLFLLAEGFTGEPHTVTIEAPPQRPQWQLATGLTPAKVDKRGFGTYLASNYDTLVDCPVETGAFWSGTFTARGIAHRMVVANAPPSFDGTKLLLDTQAICEHELQFWHLESPNKRSDSKAIPFRNYVFLVNTAHDGYGGLEHNNSTALLCNRGDLPRLERHSLAPATHKQPEGYTRLLGLISHEYFHTWNVRRLRPAQLASYDYARENYTDLLWFFEGFTSYYDDLFLRRSHRIDSAAYLKLLSKTINQVMQTPGRLVQTVAQASMDAWVKYYRQDENTPNATVSYYTKGSLVALCLDLTLRIEGRTSLDAVMRGLWERCRGGPMTEQDLLDVLQALGGRSFSKEIRSWVHSTRELPALPLLKQHGIAAHEEPAQVAQQLGLRVKETNGLHIQNVMRDSVAEVAGFASGDEWIAVEPATGEHRGPWRIHSLEDFVLYSGNAKAVRIWLNRDRRMLQLTLTLPKPSTSVRLSLQDAALAKPWLEGI